MKNIKMGELDGVVRQVESWKEGTCQVLPLSAGKSGSEVVKLQFPDEALVLKEATPREVEFYISVAPLLAKSRLTTPRLESIVDFDGQQFLLLEFIQYALPRERWYADSEVLDYLRILHNLPVFHFGDPFDVQWDQELGRQAIDLLGTSDRHQELVSGLLPATSELLRGNNFLSYDTNPSNWGVADDGRLVLFDWERAGYGHPAIDLAVFTPGLGTARDFEVIVREYLQCNDPAVVRHWTRLAITAKMWTIFSFITHDCCKSSKGLELRQNVAPLVPSWLDEVASRCLENYEGDPDQG